jgi:hypothetical protein
MNKQNIDFSKLFYVNSPLCENCDGVIMNGKCKGINKMKTPCPERFKDKYGDWYQK